MVSKMELDMSSIDKILWRLNLKAFKVYPKPAIKFMKHYFKNKEITGAEVGVYVGRNAKSILQILNIKKLYLIDFYQNYVGYIGGEFLKAKRKAIKNVSFWKDKIEFIEKMSKDAIDDIPKLDFVYIDANPSYEYVKQDIKNYWDKIKKRGIMAGDNFHFEREGVIKAVVEFCSKNKLKLFVGGKNWWIIKTKIK